MDFPCFRQDSSSSQPRIIPQHVFGIELSSVGETLNERLIGLTSRHDFYQTDTHVIVAVYLKGYAAPELAKQVNVSFENRAVSR